MKRILSVFLAVMMAVGCMACVNVAFADGWDSNGSITYDAKDYLVKYVCIKEDTVYSDGGKFTANYSYDSKGNNTKSTHINNGEKTPHFIKNSEYDSKYNLLKESITYSGSGYSTKYTYDANGNVTKKVVSSVQGIVTYKSTNTYTYDSKGRLIKSAYTESPSLSKSDESTVYTYDSNDRVTKEVYKYYDYYGKSSTNTITRTFDKYGNLTKMVNTTKDSSGTQTTTYTNTYNSKNFLTKEVISTKTNSGTDTSTNTYTYDTKGNVIKEVGTFKYGKYTNNSTTNYTYDSKSNLTKTWYSIKDSDGSVVSSVSTYTYDSKGNITKETYKYDEDGNSTSRQSTYTYNSKGDLTKEVVVSKEGTFIENTTTTYSYDSKSNMTKKTISSEGTDGKSSTTYVYSYDSNGNKTKEVETNINSDGKKDIATTNYTYKKLEKPVCRITDETYEIRMSGYSYTYDGKAKKPTVWVEGYDKGAEYKLSYKNNTNAGTAQAIIVFVGDFSFLPSLHINFEIKKSTTMVAGLKTTKVTKDSVALSWSKLAAAKYYKVEQSTDGKSWKILATTDKNTYTATKLKSGTKYQYRVTGLDAGKKALGNPSVVVKAQTICAAPTIKLASTKAKTATVTITKVTGATKYTIYKSTDNKTWKKVGDTTKLTYTLSSLSAGKKIYVKAVAVNSDAKVSAYSSVKNVTVKK